MDVFLTPTEYAYVTVPARSEPELYLQRVRTNILAEFWMFVQSPSPATFDIVKQGREGSELITDISIPDRKPDPFHVAQYVNDMKTEKEKEKKPELNDFHNHFGVINKTYCLLRFTKEKGLQVSEGSYCDRDHSTRRGGHDRGVVGYYSHRTTVFYDYGFIGDMLNEFHAVESLLRCGNAAGILAVVADPTKRISANFTTATVDRLSAPGISPANVGQSSAIQGLRASIEGIQGPPGTGKSTVIAHILRSSLPRHEVALVTCVQNKAVDAIAEKLRIIGNSQVPFLVFGNVDRLGLIAREWTLDAQVEYDPSVIAIKRKLDHYRSRLGDVQAFLQRKVAILNENYLHARRRSHLLSNHEVAQMTHDEFEIWVLRSPWIRVWKAFVLSKYRVEVQFGEAIMQKLKHLRTSCSAITKKVRHGLISTCRAVLCTTATASGSLASDEELAPVFTNIRTIIIDEAGTVSESKMPLLVSLNPAGILRIIAIGDQNQLSPFSRQSTAPKGGGSPHGCHGSYGSRFGERKGALRSRAAIMGVRLLGFFQRVEKALPSGSIPSLTEQFRMHPAVCAFVAEKFYDGCLTTNPYVASARIRADSVGLWWVNYRSQSAESTPVRSSSKLNEIEATLAVDLLDREDMLGKTVMVITFYKAQETLMKRMLIQRGRNESEAVRILSVDQSQGSEADIVILSCVRCNPMKKIGFVTDPNRMNVAISRMKNQLIIIGSYDTLSVDPKWAALYQASKKSESPPLLIPF